VIEMVCGLERHPASWQNISSLQWRTKTQFSLKFRAESLVYRGTLRAISQFWRLGAKRPVRVQESNDYCRLWNCLRTHTPHAPRENEELPRASTHARAGASTVEPLTAARVSRAAKSHPVQKTFGKKSWQQSPRIW